MANKELRVKIQDAYDTEFNWKTNDPVLLAGQLAFSSDKYGKYKVGDGVKTWNQLEYVKTKWEDIDEKPSTFNPSAHTHTISQISDIGNANVKHANTAGSATTATKLGTATKGSATQPIYLNAGVPTVCSYTLGKSVPSNAVFTDTNTWIALKGATTTATGTAGYAPAPAAGAANRYLRSDGTWAVPPDTNTTYDVVSTTANGLAPMRDGSTAHFLRGDGTWATPPNTTYAVASGGTNGLMSSTDKTKLDGIATGANKYVLPTASSSTLGGVKTTSQVTSSSGYTACPIISGVPYYKDTNTTYSLGSFGITATAAELNYTDGVTSNIQTQLNGKAASSHSHTKSQISDFPSSMPASDVYSWAKAVTKPSYSWGEITGKPTTFIPTAHSHHVAQSYEPSGQNNGDLWFKTI